jgi:glycosyltransferase involved in cell wall biosynthesis
VTRIAVVGTRGFPDVQGGVETYCEEMCPRLVDRGADVVAYVRAPYVDRSRGSYRGVRLVPLRCPTGRHTEAVVHTAYAVLRAHRDGADVVYFQGIGPSVLVPLARRLGMKTVVRHVGADYRRAKWSATARWFLRRCEAIGMRNADAVICVSDVIADEVRATYPGTSVAVVPNGAPRRDRVGGPGTGERFGLARGRYFLTVGRLVPEKRIEDAVAAFTSSRSLARDGWKLAVVGGARQHDRYAAALLADLATAPAVVTTGALAHDALDALYANAAGFVLPSAHEGLSLALLEALGHGVPSIVSDIPANRAVGVPDDWVVPVGDVGALRGAMEMVATMPAAAVVTARATAHRVAARHDWSTAADRTYALFERVARTTPAPREVLAAVASGDR